MLETRKAKQQPYQTKVVRTRRNQASPTLLVGMENGAAILAYSLGVSSEA